MTNQISFIRIFSYLAGTCDVITGILLVCVPNLVLSVLSVPEVVEASVYLRYIGAFVFCVGITYFLPTIFSKSDFEFLNFTSHVWIITSLTRLVICIFVVSQVAIGELHFNWLLVALTDGFLAIAQLIGVKVLDFER